MACNAVVDDDMGNEATRDEAVEVVEAVLLTLDASNVSGRRTTVYELYNAPAEQVADAPPGHPEPLTQDGLLGLFDGKDTGADFVLEPATDADMRGKYAAPKVSLEVVYDDA